jgi:hypothetical protein
MCSGNIIFSYCTGDTGKYHAEIFFKDGAFNGVGNSREAAIRAAITDRLLARSSESTARR